LLHRFLPQQSLQEQAELHGAVLYRIRL
jgi:hypothetical protein